MFLQIILLFDVHCFLLVHLCRSSSWMRRTGSEALNLLLKVTQQTPHLHPGLFAACQVVLLSVFSLKAKQFWAKSSNMPFTKSDVLMKTDHWSWCQQVYALLNRHTTDGLSVPWQPNISQTKDFFVFTDKCFLLILFSIQCRVLLRVLSTLADVFDWWQ